MRDAPFLLKEGTRLTTADAKRWETNFKIPTNKGEIKMESTTNKDELERVARDFPQFARTYAATCNELVVKEQELEKLRAEGKTQKEESTTQGIRIVLNAIGLLTLLVSLGLVVVLPLAEKIIYFYMGRLSFVEKECLLTGVQILVLFGIYYAYRAFVAGKSKR